MIYIVDYGMSNLQSVGNALRYLGADCSIITEPVSLVTEDRLILPGVGAYGDAMGQLSARGFVPWLEEAVLVRKHPFLGVCLGMQLIARSSEEFGDHQGLGWIGASVKRFPEGLRLPHMGWNDLSVVTGHPLLEGIPARGAFYFLHSYYLELEDRGPLVATSDYGFPFPAVICQGNIAATQFHPEKSQDNGLRILENFLEWQPC